MVEQRILDGGPWLFDDPEVAFDGYFESWGEQDATIGLGPTFDGVAQGLPPAGSLILAQRRTDLREGGMVRTR